MFHLRKPSQIDLFWFSLKFQHPAQELFGAGYFWRVISEIREIKGAADVERERGDFKLNLFGDTTMSASERSRRGRCLPSHLFS